MAISNCTTEGLKEIFEIAKNVTSAVDVDALLKRISAAAERLLNAEASSIMLMDDDKQSLSFKVATGEKGGVVQKMKVKIGEGVAGLVAQNKKLIVSNDAAKDPRFNSQMDKMSGFVTRSLICVPMLVEAELVGVVEVLNKKVGGFDPDDTVILESLASLAAVSISNARIAEDQRNFFVNVIEILIVAVESRDPRLAGHSWNVAQLATTLGRRMGVKDQEYKGLYYGALLHDIGFINVKEFISQGRTSDAETTHPKSGAEMVRNINLLKSAEPVIRHHHENFDGTGYPDGLSGEKIPLGARIVAVAEAVEEMRMNGYDTEKIKQMLKLGEHTRFDPLVVEQYIKEFSEAAV
jgi:putative nucleotidyltransferase with HDIG domain